MTTVQLGEQVLRLLVATGVGMILGLEREWREKAAGFRTLALVSLGAAAFMLVGDVLAPDAGGRIAAGIVTGIGFLGAGAILQERGGVVGLTTAATVWMAAALGVASAAGEYSLALAGLGLSLAVLLLFPVVDITPLTRDLRVYDIRYRSSAWNEAELSRHLRGAGLTVSPSEMSIDAEGISVVWRATGRPARHREAIESLNADPDVVRIAVSG